MEEKLYDVRMAERNILTGRLTPSDIEKYEKSLEDMADNCEEINLEEEPKVESTEEESSDSLNYSDDISL